MIADKISIIMGIYNCEITLQKAIDSILAQTYTNWELIMCDDGSTDATYEVAKQYQLQHPDRIIVIRNEKNLGLNKSLNHCIRYVHGEYVARQDADDWSLPERFEKELAFLKQHPDCSFVSTPMIVNNGQQDVTVRYLRDEFPEKEGFMTSNQFHHATVIIKTADLLAVGGYSEDERLLRVEDYNLWTKLYAAGYRGCNMDEPLYVVVEDESTYGRRKFKYRLNGAYAKSLAIRMLKLPKTKYIYVAYSIAKGFVPPVIYRYWHTKRAVKKAQNRE